MTDQQAFEQLKDFFETRPACKVAADPLRQGVEIGIVINDRTQCAFFKDGDKPRFEQRPANKPDVVFYISPDAVQPILSHTSDDIGELGITIAKQYLAGTVKIKVQGSMIGLLTNGYLGVIKSGGISFGKFLAQHGVTGLGKVKDVIQNLRKKE
jgi:hypothetical protein